MTVSQLESEMSSVESELNEMKPNTSAIAAFKRKCIEYKERLAEVAHMTTERELIRTEFDSLRKRRLDEFMRGFVRIGTELKQMYRMLTFGGDCELELVDTSRPVQRGNTLHRASAA